MSLDSQITRAVVVSVPACMLLAGSLTLFLRRQTPSSFLQLIGAGCFLVVVLAHLCEALQLLPSMKWGLDRSHGHYLDLGSLVLGLLSFALGYLLHALNLKSQ